MKLKLLKRLDWKRRNDWLKKPKKRDYALKQKLKLRD